MFFNEDEANDEGLYVAALYDADTCRKLSEYQRKFNIPNPTPESGFHTTIVYSRVPVDFEEMHTVDETVNPAFSQIEVWPNDYGNVLVLKIFSPYLHLRFQEAMAAGATYDFPEYQPHVTLSYDIGDWDHKQLKLPDFPLVITGEYSEPLYFDEPKKPLDEKKWSAINKNNRDNKE